MVKGKESTQLEDGISLLPDCLLVEIISRLPSTDEAIRTGTLSKRWQHLWTHLPNLIVKHDSADDLPQFYSSIERILTQRGQSNLNKFQLHASYTEQTESQVNNCIRNAINHNVQEVDLDLSYYPLSDFEDNGFVLPEFFFICSSFIHLTLHDCIFKKADIISWKNLKRLSIIRAYLYQDWIENILSGSPLLETLELHYCDGFERLDITNESVKKLTLRDCVFEQADIISWKNLKRLSIIRACVHEDWIENILSGSPLLETLELGYCYGFERLDITNESVKNLVFSGYDNSYIYSVEINAPFIQSLTIQGSYLLQKLLLLNVSSVIKAELNYYNERMYGEREMYEDLEEILLEKCEMYEKEEENMLEGLLLSLDHVKEVTIGKSCLEALARLKAKGFICPSNLKVLGEIDAS